MYSSGSPEPSVKVFDDFYLASCQARVWLYKSLAAVLESELGQGWEVILTQLGKDGAVSKHALLEVHHRRRVLELSVNARCNAVRIIQTGETERMVTKIEKAIRDAFESGEAIARSVLIAQRNSRAERINRSRGTRYFPKEM